MTNEPRTRAEYGGRETEAARRVLVDLGQVLAAYFKDCIVVVGGWVPELLLPSDKDPHSGSTDVDLALEPAKLGDNRYAEIVESLLVTGRYRKTDKPFRLQAEVDLGDGRPAIPVDVDFLKPPGKLFRSKGIRLLPDFRPLDADGCAAAFRRPERKRIEGYSIAGAKNRVSLLVASVPDFLVMKAHALAGRDKPKDAYDICYCLDNVPKGIESIASKWRDQRNDPLVADAIGHLQDKFDSVGSFGPMQVVEFLNAATPEESDIHARRAFELVRRLLDLIGER
jgi:hypothetical protein